jgi:O-antigen ligase
MLPFVVAFGSLFSFTVHGLNAGLTDVLVGALCISTLWHTWRSRGAAVEGTALHSLTLPGPADLRRQLIVWWRRDRMAVLCLGAVLTYLAVVVLSVGVAESKSLALKEVIKWAEVLIVLVLALQLIQSVENVHRLAWAMITAGVCQALLGYWQWVQVTGSHSASAASLRVFGTFGQPNPFGGYLNFALLLAVALVFFGKETYERWIAGAAAAIIAYAAVLADSRGAELGLAAAVIVLLIVAWRREKLAAVAVVIALPLLAAAWFAHIIPTHLREDLQQQVTLGPVNSASFSIQERLAHWVAGLRMFRAHPILGVGAGNYSVAYARYQVSPDWFEALGHAHNYYINAAAETGILGFLAIVALVGTALLAGWRAAREQAKAVSASHQPSVGWALALGLLAALVAHSVHNLTDDLFVHGIELQFALCVACLLLLLRAAHLSLRDQEVHDQGPQMRPKDQQPYNH